MRQGGGKFVSLRSLGGGPVELAALPSSLRVEVAACASASRGGARCRHRWEERQAGIEPRVRSWRDSEQALRPRSHRTGMTMSTLLALRTRSQRVMMTFPRKLFILIMRSGMRRNMANGQL